MQQTGHQLEQSSFASTIWTEQAHNFAAPYLDGYIIQSFERKKFFADVTNLNHNFFQYYCLDWTNLHQYELAKPEKIGPI
jgi:hypothetical protein